MSTTAIAIAQIEGPSRRLEAIAAIPDRDRLADYPFYFAALGEFELRSGRTDAARHHFTTALERARNPAERRFLEERMAACADSSADSV